MSKRKITHIKIIKFKNGECVISQTVLQKDGTYLLIDPLQMIHIPKVDENNQIINTEMALRDWIEGTVITKFTVKPEDILIITDCQISLQMIYAQAISAMTQKERQKRERDYKGGKSNENKMFNKGGLTSSDNGPDLERFREGEDEIDGGWADIPPDYDI